MEVWLEQTEAYLVFIHSGNLLINFLIVFIIATILLLTQTLKLSSYFHIPAIPISTYILLLQLEACDASQIFWLPVIVSAVIGQHFQDSPFLLDRHF